jgi:diguanylate cyclase (GGDEF)-like protein/PAS domain S-box-containing protein
VITEDQRLQTLRSYGVVDTGDEPGLDALARAAARACEAPIALITFIEQDRQVFAARVGTDLEGVDRDGALCNVVLEERQAVGVPDLQLDQRFAGHPLVVGPPSLRAYFGEPLIAPDGGVIGSLCVLDVQPRHLTAAQRQTLRDLAQSVMALLRERLHGRESLRAEVDAQLRSRVQLDALHEFVAALPIGWVESDLQGNVHEANEEFCRLMGRSRDQLQEVTGPHLATAASRERIRRDLDGLVEGRVRSVRASRAYLRPDGAEVPVVVTTVLVRDLLGRPCGFRAFVVDDAAGDRARRQLEEATAELDRRNSFLANLIDTLDVGLLACNAHGELLLWNRALQDMRSADGVVWDPAAFDLSAQTQLFAPGAVQHLRREDLPLVRALHGEDVDHEEVLSVGPLGSTRRLSASGRQVRAAGSDQVIGAVAAFTDITDERAREQALQTSVQRFRAGFQSSPIGMAVVDRAGLLVEVNASLARSFDRPVEAVLGRPVEDFVLAADVAAMRQQLLQAGTSDGDRLFAELHFVSGTGRVLTGKTAVVRLPTEQGPPLLLVQLEDVTEQRAAEQQLAASSLTDGLTGLPNRALFTDRTAQALTRSTRSDRPLAVMFCDLDGFKLVNDGLGHAVGDEALRQAAGRLTAAMRPEDTVARIGGDEFVILCEDTDGELAGRLAGELERAFHQPLQLGSDEVLVTVSIGVTVHQPGDGPVTVEELVHDADTAMYRAKELGKNRHTVFDAGLRAEAVARRGIEQLIRSRLATGGVEVHYQPVVDLRTGVVRGVEALCRLRDDDGDMVPPSSFIPVAEGMGLIAELGDAVLRAAVSQAAAWNRAGHDLHVAVNASARQAQAHEYARGVLSTLAEAGLAPHRLTLELTESMLIEATATTLRELGTLREAGVGIAIDDFGTQYGSLRYVQQLPVTALKIDISFTAGLPDGRPERAIVTSIAQLATSLDLECVAEGIETPHQAAYLTELGVLGQGYLLGRPVPGADVDLGPRPLHRL